MRFLLDIDPELMIPMYIDSDQLHVWLDITVIKKVEFLNAKMRSFRVHENLIQML